MCCGLKGRKGDGLRARDKEESRREIPNADMDQRDTSDIKMMSLVQNGSSTDFSYYSTNTDYILVFKPF